MRRRSSVTFLVAVVVAAGCGGGGKAKATSTVPTNEETTSTTVAPTTTALVTTTIPATSSSGPATTGPDLNAKAKAAILQLADFPAGFTPQPDDPKSGVHLELIWDELIGCLGVPKVQPAGIAASLTILRPLATQGVSTVEYTTAASVEAAANALTAPKFLACSTKAFIADLNRSKPDGSTPGTLTISQRDVPPIGALKVAAWRINASVNNAGLLVPLFQDFLVIFKGTAIIRLCFLSPGSEFPPTLERTLVETVVGRV